jgi:hypothetical protein
VHKVQCEGTFVYSDVCVCEVLSEENVVYSYVCVKYKLKELLCILVCV